MSLSCKKVRIFQNIPITHRQSLDSYVTTTLTHYFSHAINSRRLLQLLVITLSILNISSEGTNKNNLSFGIFTSYDDTHFLIPAHFRLKPLIWLLLTVLPTTCICFFTYLLLHLLLCVEYLLILNEFIHQMNVCVYVCLLFLTVFWFPYKLLSTMKASAWIAALY